MTVWPLIMNVKINFNWGTINTINLLSDKKAI